jgi:hypothetical protein
VERITSGEEQRLFFIPAGAGGKKAGLKRRDLQRTLIGEPKIRLGDLGQVVTRNIA